MNLLTSTFVTEAEAMILRAITSFIVGSLVGVCIADEPLAHTCMKALRNNYLGVESYDVVLDFQSSGESLEGIKDSRSSFRILLDAKEQRAVAIWIRQGQFGNEKIALQAGVAVVEHNSYWLRRFPGGTIRKGATADFRKYLEGLGMVNVLLTGVMQFPSGAFAEQKCARHWEEQLAKTKDANLTWPRPGHILATSDPGFYFHKPSIQSKHVERIEFGVRDYLPSSIKVNYMSKGDAGPIDQVLHAEKITWLEDDSGLYLPQKVHYVNVTPTLLPDRSSVEMLEEVCNVEIDWKSVNADLEQLEEFSKPEYWTSVVAVLDACDWEPGTIDPQNLGKNPPEDGNPRVFSPKD